MSDTGEQPKKRLSRRDALLGAGAATTALGIGVVEFGPRIASKDFPTFPQGDAPEQPVTWDERTQKRMRALVDLFAVSPGFTRSISRPQTQHEYATAHAHFSQFMRRYAHDVAVVMNDALTTPEERTLLTRVRRPARAAYVTVEGKHVILIPHRDTILDDFIAELSHHINADSEFRRGLRGFVDRKKEVLVGESVYEQHFAMEFQAHSVTQPVLLGVLRCLGQRGEAVPVYPLLKDAFAKYPEIVSGKSSYETTPTTGHAVYSVIEYACSYIPFRDGATLQSKLNLGLTKLQGARAFIDAMPYDNAKKNGLLHFALVSGMLFSELNEIKAAIERKAKSER
jgi:hypothetical protein